MAINNIDETTLTFIFSIAKDPKTSAWGVQVVESYEHNSKKGVDLNIGPLHLGKNWTEGSMGTATMMFNEAALKKKIARLRQLPVIEAEPYEKALAALMDFKKAPADEGYEVLRQTNTFDFEGNRLTGRKAVLRTVEKDASGSETSSAKVFKKKDLARYAWQISDGDINDRVWHAGFYSSAAEKIGGKSRSLDELSKPFKFEKR